MHMQDGNPCLRDDPGTRESSVYGTHRSVGTGALQRSKSFNKENLVSGSTAWFVWADSRPVSQLPSLKFPQPLSFSPPKLDGETVGVLSP